MNRMARVPFFDRAAAYSIPARSKYLAAFFDQMCYGFCHVGVVRMTLADASQNRSPSLQVPPRRV
jgi:hypothetical protein